VRALLGLGSNLGDRMGLLCDAVSSLDGIVAVSSVYETEPVGGPADQDPYLNIVLELDTDLSAHELLGVCHRLESAADRVRHERWGPRTLDVDILWMACGPVDEPDLQVPHPRMSERRFVMEPLLEVAPDLVPGDWQDHVEGRVTCLGPFVCPTPDAGPGHRAR
jgi:2-amino-4-hydroxy-6-hydroxymethyldihydropteridine diphosphokinase